MDDLTAFVNGRIADRRKLANEMKAIAHFELLGQPRLFVQRVSEQLSRDADAHERIVREHANAVRLGSERAGALASVLFTLAAINSDHSDYEEGWRP